MMRRKVDPGAPAISCLLPVRDAEATLGTALRSIARQTETDFECLVLDDGSRDASRELAAAHAARDPRFRVLPLPRNGLIDALNVGLEASRGRLVARMDADDWMHAHRFAEQRAALAAHSEWAGVGTHVRMFPRRALGPGMRAYEAWLNSQLSPDDVRRDAFVECPLAHPTWLLRRAAIPAGGYRDAGWPEDYDLFLRMALSGAPLGVVPRRLLGWRRRAASLSCADARYGDDAFRACKAAFLARGPLAAAREYVLWGYGGTGRALCRALRAHDRRPSHVVELHPGRLGNRIHGAPVVAPERLPEIAPRHPIVVSVAGAGPRRQIRAALDGMGFRESRDFVVAA